MVYLNFAYVRLWKMILKMKLTCSLCERDVDTKKEDVFMTVKWCFEELLKLNKINIDKDLSRVVGSCSDCWANKLKKKLSSKNYYWIYNKEI